MPHVSSLIFFPVSSKYRMLSPIWQLLKDEIAKVEPELASCMVRECVYRGFCPEMYGCGFDKTEEHKKELERYHAIPEVQK